MRCGAFHRVEGTLCLVRHGQAALSGSKTKAPGFAGGYLLWTANLRKKSEGGLFSQVFFCPSVRAARRGAGIQRHSLVRPWDRNTTVPAHKNARAHAQLPAPRWKQHSSGLLICEKNRRGDYFPRFSSAPRSEPQGMALYGFFDEIDAFFPHQRFSAAKL